MQQAHLSVQYSSSVKCFGVAFSLFAVGNFSIQGVHEQINCEPSRTEWAEDGSDRESKLVFIGLELNKDDISAKLQKCLVSN